MQRRWDSRFPRQPFSSKMEYLDVTLPGSGSDGMLPTPQADRGKMAVPATDHALGDMFESTSSISSSKARSPQIVDAGSTWLTKEA